ncbi:MAG TPA: DUF4956 domain-containing protein [Gemmatimonadales bacterium]|nr:DUF4956 domain-containing protein [Gemmatimonadales bacterium]
MNGLSALRRPVLRLAVYYGLLVFIVWAVAAAAPAVPALLARYREVPAPVSLSNQVVAPPMLSQGEWALVTLFVMLIAIALVLPVAWVYMITKRRGGYDQSVVQTVIILPMTVAGTVILVRNSLALAFALAAIVAAVRFRNTLKDTKDAVYIFLALAVGVAAGVLATSVAGVLSLVFNVTVLVLWAFNVGNIYADRLGGERAERLAPHLDAADEKKKKRFNGALLIKARQLAPVQAATEELLEDQTKRWKLVGVAPAAQGVHTLEYLVRIKDESGVSVLLDAIRAAGAADVVNAEFRSLRGLEDRSSA